MAWLDAWTLLGRIPAALVVLWLVLHARRTIGTTRAAVGGTGLIAGLAAGAAATHGIAGALAGGLAGWAVALAAMGVRLPWASQAAQALLLLVGVGRVGCLVAGCCFGTPADLPWAVAYGEGSFAHHLHVGLGWADPHGPARAVHPVAAYESVLLLLAAAAFPALRSRIRNDRALALWAAGGYLLLRAALDPLRGMVNTPGSLDALGPLSVAQWAYLGAGLALLAAGRLVPPPRCAGAPGAASGASGAAVPPPFRAIGAWAAAAGVFAACHPALPPFVAALAIAWIAAAGLMLARDTVVAALPARRLELGAVALGMLLLVPAGLRASADEGGGRHWVYSVDPINARLVRIGDQSTPMERLAQADAEFDPQASGLPAKAAPASTQPDASASAGPGEPSSPQPATAAPSAPASTQPDAPASAGPGEPSSPQPAAPSFGRQPPPPPPPLDEWPRGRRLTFHAGGGYLRTVEEGSCGGPSTIYVNVPFTAGLSIGREAAPSDELRESWQVGVGVLGERWSRATEGKPERDVEGLDLLGTFGGIYHWDWRWIGLGVGGMAGFGRANAPDRFPIAIGDVGFAVPGAYFRVGPPVFAYESGLGNVDLYWPGVFGGFRTIFNAGHALRFGWHLPRWSRPLATSMFYLDLRLRVAAAHGLILRVDVPAKSFNAVHGIAGWAVDF